MVINAKDEGMVKRIEIIVEPPVMKDKESKARYLERKATGHDN